MRVFVHGCGAVSACGVGAAPLVDALLSGRSMLRHDAPLSRAFDGQLAAELDELPSAADRDEARARRMMSRGAALAAVAASDLASSTDAAPLDDAAFFMGVGPSGGDLSQIATLLRTGQTKPQLDLCVLGAEGLAATHPLLGFSLMNNFTLCHAAILHCLQGPNAAFFSRGGGTWAALEEAVATLNEGLTSLAWVGGADAGTHVTTWEETCREVDAPRPPGEGGALLALSRAPSPVALTRLSPWEEPLDLTGSIVISCMEVERDAPEQDRQLRAAAARFDLCAIVGSCLAGTPALGWAAAAELIARRQAERAVVVAEGIDGEAWTARFEAAS